MWWERFSSESEAFSLWINEKERELEAVSSTSSLDPLDQHISTVEVCLVSHYSLKYHSLPCFVSHSGKQIKLHTVLLQCLHNNQ